MKKLTLTLSFVLLFVTIGIAQQKMDKQQIVEMMQDSTTRMMIMEHMAQNPEMRQQMMKHMVESMRKDSAKMMANMQRMMNNPRMRDRMQTHMQMMQSMMQDQKMDSTMMRNPKMQQMMPMHMMYMQMMQDSTMHNMKQKKNY